MNFLVERMEHPGKRSKHIPKFNDIATNKTVETIKGEMTSEDTVLPLKPPVRINSANDMKRTMSKPILVVNDKPINPIRSSSQRNLTSVFRNDLFHSNSSDSFNIKEEKEEGLSITSSGDDDENDEGIIEFPTRKISRRRKENIEKEVQVYCSAFGGKFSDFEFSTVTPIPPKRAASPQSLNSMRTATHSSDATLSKSSRRFSTNTFSESPFKGNHNSVTSSTGRKKRSMSNNGFTNDSNKAQTKRLVDQFLQSSKGSNFPCSNSSSLDPSMVELSALTNHRIKDLNSCNQFTDYSNLTFQNLLYQDLDQSHITSSFLISNENSPGSSTSSFLNTKSDDKIMDSIPSDLAYQNSMDTRRTTPLSSASQLETNRLLSSSKSKSRTHMQALKDQDNNPANMKSYKKHISTTLKSFENTMKESLQQIIFVDEANLIRTVGQFDRLAMDLNESKQQLIDLQKLIGCDYLNALQANFDDKEETAFIYKLQQNVDSSVSDLKRLEAKMEKYKTKLAEQRETIKKLESVVKIDNSVVQAKNNTKSVYKYRFIVIDLLIISVFIYFVTLLKNMLW